MTQDALHRHLTRPLLEAMASALHAALAGGAEGDFEGEDMEHYERALDWIAQEMRDRGYDRRGGNR